MKTPIRDAEADLLAAACAIVTRGVVELPEKRTLWLAALAKGFDPLGNSLHAKIAETLTNVLPGVDWRRLDPPSAPPPDYTPDEQRAREAAATAAQAARGQRDIALGVWEAAQKRAEHATPAAPGSNGATYDPSIAKGLSDSVREAQRVFDEADAAWTRARRECNAIEMRAEARRRYERMVEHTPALRPGRP